MANTSYKGLQTIIPLLIAYEKLAMEHKKNHDGRATDAAIGIPVSAIECHYETTLALLIINASMLEGIMRGILSEKLAQELRNETLRGKKEGRTGASMAESTLLRFTLDVETQGGWERLKEQYSFCYDMTFKDIFGSDLLETLESLFILRNVLAHGTSIIQPSSKMTDDMKDLYPYAWQCKLQRASVYLEKHFRGGDIFKNLAKYEVPIHFFENTQNACREAILKIPGCTPSEPINKLIGYSFGYRL